MHPSAFACSSDGVPVPVLSESIGALACSMVTRLDLQHVTVEAEGEGSVSRAKGAEQANDGEASGGSDLFLARVHAVEDGSLDRPTSEERLPLLYWDRDFTTVKR